MSIFTTHSDLTVRTKERLRVLYESDARPWGVAFSGGKDSTAVLQLVFELLVEEHARGQGLKHVFVTSSDTRVEAPNVSAYVADTLRRVSEGARKIGLPLETRLVKPDASESFRAKLIGLGYPSPTRWFRWCTTALRDDPTFLLAHAIRVKDSVPSELTDIVQAFCQTAE